MRFEQAISYWSARVEANLQGYLQQSQLAPVLTEAMQYSTFNGGKRLRPVLVYAACQALSGQAEAADPAAAAVECIHAYSLIHDDLPAMDDDDLRRGKPTCHIKFDEATAILAGDALQTLAFDILAAANPQLNAEAQLKMLQVLAAASGDKGMVAGQSIDMQMTGQAFDLAGLEQMHRLKTGALIRASVALGALASNNASTAQLQQLDDYAAALGLAFQVQDDILDIEGDTATLGKPQGSDINHQKVTYPALLGVDGAKAKLQDLHTEALAALSGFDEQALLLRQLADFVINRDH